MEIDRDQRFAIQAGAGAMAAVVISRGQFHGRPFVQAHTLSLFSGSAWDNSSITFPISICDRYHWPRENVHVKLNAIYIKPCITLQPIPHPCAQPIGITLSRLKNLQQRQHRRRAYWRVMASFTYGLEVAM